MTEDNRNHPDDKDADGQEMVDEQPSVESPVEGKEVNAFLQRLPGNFRWPKPNAEAVAAAVEAIQRMSGGAAAARDLAAAGEEDETSAGEPANSCSACGGSLPMGARFCVWCGVAHAPVAGDAHAQARPGVAQTHVHHHYHHHIGSGQEGASGGLAPAAGFEPAASSVPRGRAPGAPGSTGGRAEAGARQVVQDWAQACNIKHVDDLIELYAADATLIRSSVPPVRSLPAIREFLISLLEAGLGDVEMESLRVEVMGEIALDLGRCKMLVPVAMGKRREERGKYLVVLVRQPAGTWKILADCWSSDLPVSTPPESAARKGK
ncbi:MAG: DUF4440 domain-containing protein [Terriglobales bacterium]